MGKKEISIRHAKKQSNLFILIQQANSDKNYEIQIPKINGNKRNTTQTQTLS